MIGNLDVAFDVFPGRRAKHQERTDAQQIIRPHALNFVVWELSCRLGNEATPRRGWRPQRQAGSEDPARPRGRLPRGFPVQFLYAQECEIHLPVGKLLLFCEEKYSGPLVGRGGL